MSPQAIATWIESSTEIRAPDAATYAQVLVECGCDTVEKLALLADTFDTTVGGKIGSVIHHRALKKAIDDLATSSPPASLGKAIGKGAVDGAAIVGKGGKAGVEGKGLGKATGKGAAEGAANDGKGGKAGVKGAGKAPSKPPPGGTPGRGTGTEKPDWRAQAEAKKALQAMWKSLDVRRLPAGPIDAPRWDTTFALQMPDSGMTKSAAFVATFAGSYCIKGLQPAESFANNFNRWLGAPSPRARAVPPGSPELDEILAALARASSFGVLRGLDDVGARVGQFGRGLTIMSMIPDASMFAGVPATAGRLLFEPCAASSAASGDLDSWAAATQRAAEMLGLPPAASGRDEVPQSPEAQEAARVRLQALGRIFFADICLFNGDRFMLPLHVSQPTLDGLLRKQAGEKGKVFGDLTKEPAGTYNMESKGAGQRYLRVLQEVEDTEFLSHLIGNADNTLLKEASNPERARFVAIDNIAAPIWEKPPHAFVCNYLEDLLAEAQEGGPSSAPVVQWEFVRWTLRMTCSGYVVSDAALREIRVGFLHAVRQFAAPDAMDSMRGTLGDQIHWDKSLVASFGTANYDYTVWADAIQQVMASIRAVTAPFRDLLEALPPAAPTLASEAGPPAETRAPHGASPALWQALQPQLRNLVLQDLGLEAGEA